MKLETEQFKRFDRKFFSGLCIFLFVLFFSCKKEDTLDPVIVLEKPASQITVGTSDTILVEAKITDNENIEKIKTIIDFSNKLIQNTTDIDGEFVDIVNKHFWELI